MKLSTKIKGIAIAWFFNKLLGIFLWVVRHLVRPEKRLQKTKNMYDRMQFIEEDFEMFVELYLVFGFPYGNFFILKSLNDYYSEQVW